MSETYYRTKLSCGHSLIGGRKISVGQHLRCPEHGIVTAVEVEEGTIEAYRGFVPKVLEDTHERNIYDNSGPEGQVRLRTAGSGRDQYRQS